MTVLLAAVLTLASGPGQAGRVPAPELVAGPRDWVQGGPVSLARLRGKVVLIDFWEYTCVNCVRTFPYLREWRRRYGPHGFEIVGVHAPEFEFGKSRENVRAAARRFGLRFPILLDNGRANWRNYRVEGWPTKVLLNAQGVPIHAYFGERDYARFERMIQAELRKKRPGLRLPPIMEPVHSTDREGAICYGKTPEVFLGQRGIREGQFGSPGVTVGRTATYAYPPQRLNDLVYFGGRWSTRADHSEGAAGSTAWIRYLGKEINAVIQPVGELRVEVMQDGRPLPAAALGGDVQLVNGRSILRAREPRMYSLVRNPKWGRYTLELRALTGSLRLYTFSFTTECARVQPR